MLHQLQNKNKKENNTNYIHNILLYIYICYNYIKVGLKLYYRRKKVKFYFFVLLLRQIFSETVGVCVITKSAHNSHKNFAALDDKVLAL